MNKNLFMSGVVLVLTLLLVNAAFALTITSNTDPGAVNPGQTATGSFVLKNNDAATANGISISAADLVGVTDNTKKISASSVSFSPASVSSLATDASATISTSVAVPENLAAQTYQGIVTVSVGGVANTTFTLSAVVNSYSALDVLTYDTTTDLKVYGQEDTTQTATFNIKNIGNVILSSPTFSNSITLTDSDGDAITLSFSNPGSINPAETKVVTVTAAFGNNIDLDTYSGNVTVTSGSASDSFKLSLVVQPEVCSDGIVKDGIATGSSNAHLSIDVRSPDTGDDIKPGETLNIEVKIKNSDDQDMDVVVEAFLYNLDEDDEISSVESDSVNINDGDTETFELELEVPKSSDLDTADTYVLYIKAYEDGDEEDNCNQDSLNLNLKRESHDVVVKDITLIPSSVTCGENIEIKVDVENQGTKDEDDVYIIVKNSELGLNLESNKFDLDKYSGSEESATKRFNFVIPAGASAKEYLLEAVVYFDDADSTNSDFETLKVGSCDGSTINTDGSVAPTTALSIATDTQLTTTKGLTNLHLVISNSGNRDLIGTLSFTTVGGWADSLIGQPVSLHSGDNNIYLPINLKGAAAGMNTATITVRPVRAGDFEEKQFTLNFDVKESAESTEGVVSGNLDFLKGRSTTFWIAVDLALIGIALLIIKAAFSRRPSL